MKQRRGLRGAGSTGFQPVPDGQLIKARRLLPHWQMGGSTYFVTFRSMVTNLVPEAREIVLDACCYFDDAKYRLWAAVVMPDHVHLLLTPKGKAQGGFFFTHRNFTFLEVIHGESDK